MKRAIALAMLFLAFSLAAGAEELPGTVFKNFPIADESSSEVGELVQKGAALVYPQPREARRLFVEALTKVDKGARIGEYEYVWVLYGLLKSTFETGTSTFGPGTKADYMKLARKAIAFLEENGVGQWVFTPQGQIKMEAYREAGNGLAWYLQDDPKADRKALEEALGVIEATEEFVQGTEHYFVYDTKVRILLKLGREEEAFKIVKTVLDEVPDFADFADLRKDPKYLAWAKGKGKKVSS